MARAFRFKRYDGVRRGWTQGARSIDACTEGEKALDNPQGSE
jgi:hypothetical protein